MIHKIEGPMFDPEMEEEKVIDPLPTGKIENALNKYAKDIEEEEKFYKQKIEDDKAKKLKEEEEMKALTQDIVQKRPIMQTQFELIKAQEDDNTKSKADEDWLYEYRKEEFYVQREKEIKEKEKLKEEKKEEINLGGGFSKDLSKSGRSKRKKWDKNANNVIKPVAIDQDLNSKTAAQLDRLANIQVEASKQDMLINEVYEHIQEQKKLDEELKNISKPIKDKVKREKPVTNIPKSGLFSVESWLSQIGGTESEKLKKNEKSK